jgi:hypothetical protein
MRVVGGREIDAPHQVVTDQNRPWLTSCGDVLSNSGTSYPSYSDRHYATV